MRATVRHPRSSPRYPARRARRPARRGRGPGVATRLALVALLVGVAGGVLPVAPASADATSVEERFLARIAAAREARGLPAYEVGGILTLVAREQARRMAERDTLFHNPQLTSDVPNWRFLGENVGYGPDALTVHHAFMDSPGHRANILDRDYTRVGVGVVVRGGRVWVSEVFKTPMT